MFEQLFASRIVEKILFYLIANEKSFASELKRSFGIPIFGIQRALTRLENQGILVSIVEGNNRLYYWNPRYPFLNEFKKLIEKAYSTLPDEVKKTYYERAVRKRPRKKGKPL
jgi:DNA-binding transcriptional ArsR family regulator